MGAVNPIVEIERGAALLLSVSLLSAGFFAEAICMTQTRLKQMIVFMCILLILFG